MSWSGYWENDGYNVVILGAHGEKSWFGASRVEKNIVVTDWGIELAVWMEEKYWVPYVIIL